MFSNKFYNVFFSWQKYLQHLEDKGTTEEAAIQKLCTYGKSRGGKSGPPEVSPNLKPKSAKRQPKPSPKALAAMADACEDSMSEDEEDDGEEDQGEEDQDGEENEDEDEDEEGEETSDEEDDLVPIWEFPTENPTENPTEKRTHFRLRKYLKKRQKQSEIMKNFRQKKINMNVKYEETCLMSDYKHSLLTCTVCTKVSVPKKKFKKYIFPSENITNFHYF